MFLGRILSITGGILSVLFGLTTVVGLSNPDNEPFDEILPALIVCIILTFFFLAVWGSGIKRTRLFRNYQLYKNILSSNCIGSVEQLASEAHQTVEDVKKNIQLQQDSNLFLQFAASPAKLTPEINANLKTARTVITKCESCGATNTTLDFGGDCEYCGSPLKIPSLGIH